MKNGLESCLANSVCPPILSTVCVSAGDGPAGRVRTVPRMYRCLRTKLLALYANSKNFHKSLEINGSRLHTRLVVRCYQVSAPGTDRTPYGRSRAGVLPRLATRPRGSPPSDRSSLKNRFVQPEARVPSASVVQD